MAGPESLGMDRTAEAERHVSWVRFFVITFNVAVYFTLFDRTIGIPWLAVTISIVAFLYGAVVAAVQPQRWLGPMNSSYWTTGTDAALIVLWIMATGAAESPYFVLWSISLVAIGYRYGPRPTVQATGVYLVLEAVFLASGGVLWTTIGVIRMAYIVFVGVLMALASGFTVIGMRREQDLEALVDQVKSASNRMEVILNNAPSIIVETDREGRITFINRLQDGVTREEILGASAEAFLSEESLPRFHAAMQKVLGGQPAAVAELQGLSPGEEPRDYRAHFGPLIDAQGAIQGCIIITLDVTDEKQQQLLAEESQRRQEEVSRLEEEAKFRSRFINTAAHELNTPLTPLRLQMEVLRRTLGVSGTELRAVDIMERNLKRLEALIEDLLDATRLQENQLRLQPETVDLAPLIEEVRETFVHVAQDRNIAFGTHVEEGLQVNADAQRTTQILYNLLSNALKFTPAGGSVHCNARARTDGTVEIEVVDTGTGLSEEGLSRLFIPFSQVQPSLVPEEPGTGLGLYLSKNLAKAQGGDLVASSPGEGKGATLRLTLPQRPHEGGAGD